MAESNMTQKDNGELIFILENEEKGDWALSPELQENSVNKSSVRTKNNSQKKQNHQRCVPHNGHVPHHFSYATRKVTAAFLHATKIQFYDYVHAKNSLFLFQLSFEAFVYKLWEGNLK